MRKITSAAAWQRNGGGSNSGGGISGVARGWAMLASMAGVSAA